eukprot:1137237-Amphidinium_carterae.1
MKQHRVKIVVVPCWLLSLAPFEWRCPCFPSQFHILRWLPCFALASKLERFKLQSMTFSLTFASHILQKSRMFFGARRFQSVFASTSSHRPDYCKVYGTHQVSSQNHKRRFASHNLLPPRASLV